MPSNHPRTKGAYAQPYGLPFDGEHILCFRRTGTARLHSTSQSLRRVGLAHVQFQQLGVILWDIFLAELRKCHLDSLHLINPGEVYRVGAWRPSAYMEYKTYLVPGLYKDVAKDVKVLYADCFWDVEGGPSHNGAGFDYTGFSAFEDGLVEQGKYVALNDFSLCARDRVERLREG